MIIGATTIDRNGATIPLRYRLFKTLTGHLEGDLLVDAAAHFNAFFPQYPEDELSIVLGDGRLFQFVVTGATLPDTLHVLGRLGNTGTEQSTPAGARE